MDVYVKSGVLSEKYLDLVLVDIYVIYIWYIVIS